MTTLNEKLFNATIPDAVEATSCVAILDGDIVYAGLIMHCPAIADGTLLLLNAKDFEILQSHMKRRQN